jgi:hypothetical protein
MAREIPGRPTDVDQSAAVDDDATAPESRQLDVSGLGDNATAAVDAVSDYGPARPERVGSERGGRSTRADIDCTGSSNAGRRPATPADDARINGQVCRCRSVGDLDTADTSPEQRTMSDEVNLIETSQFVAALAQFDLGRGHPQCAVAAIEWPRDHGTTDVADHDMVRGDRCDGVRPAGASDKRRGIERQVVCCQVECAVDIDRAATAQEQCVQTAAEGRKLRLSQVESTGTAGDGSEVDL